MARPCYTHLRVLLPRSSRTSTASWTSSQNLRKRTEVSRPAAELGPVLAQADCRCDTPCPVNLSDIRRDLTELRTKLKKITDALHQNYEDILENIDSDDGYPIKMFRFTAEAKSSLDALTDKVTLAETTYSNVLNFFGENADPASMMNTDEFFGNLNTFVSSYKVSTTSCLEVYRAWDAVLAFHATARADTLNGPRSAYKTTMLFWLSKRLNRRSAKRRRLLKPKQQRRRFLRQSRRP